MSTDHALTAAERDALEIGTALFGWSRSAMPPLVTTVEAIIASRVSAAEDARDDALMAAAVAREETARLRAGIEELAMRAESDADAWVTSPHEWARIADIRGLLAGEESS